MSVEYGRARHAYRGHIDTAKKRGIVFHFTFGEWVNWWETHLGPDWLEKRGRGKGQYCMARNGDEGPYAWGNVKCITNGENTRDAAPSRIKHKLTETEIREIYLASKSAGELARTYGIRYGLVLSIKRRKMHYKVTKGLGEAPMVWVHPSRTKTHP